VLALSSLAAAARRHSDVIDDTAAASAADAAHTASQQSLQRLSFSLHHLTVYIYFLYSCCVHTADVKYTRDNFDVELFR